MKKISALNAAQCHLIKNFSLPMFLQKKNSLLCERKKEYTAISQPKCSMPCGTAVPTIMQFLLQIEDSSAKQEHRVTFCKSSLCSLTSPQGIHGRSAVNLHRLVLTPGLGKGKGGEGPTRTGHTLTHTHQLQTRQHTAAGSASGLLSQMSTLLMCPSSHAHQVRVLHRHLSLMNLCFLVWL